MYKRRDLWGLVQLVTWSHMDVIRCSAPQCGLGEVNILENELGNHHHVVMGNVWPCY